MKRGGPLKRGKRLKTIQPLKRSASLERAARKRRPARATGPSAAVRRLVLDREGMLCAACGVSVTGRPSSIQHRRARRMGGTADPAVNLPSNLVLLCGSATSPGGCHLACEDRDPDMHARGFWLWSWEDPAAIPVMLSSEHGPGITARLADDGEYLFAPPGEAGSAGPVVTPVQRASERAAKFAELRERGLTIAQASRSVGITTTTGYKYEAARVAAEPAGDAS